MEQPFQKNNSFNFDLNFLDDSQKQAVLSEAPKVLLRAPAGSGKTSCVLHAVAYYRWNFLADRICAITYTRAAKEEMVQRLNAMGIYDVEVTTIHV